MLMFEAVAVETKYWNALTHMTIIPRVMDFKIWPQVAGDMCPAVRTSIRMSPKYTLSGFRNTEKQLISRVGQQISYTWRVLKVKHEPAAEDDADHNFGGL